MNEIPMDSFEDKFRNISVWATTKDEIIKCNLYNLLHKSRTSSWKKIRFFPLKSIRWVFCYLKDDEKKFQFAFDNIIKFKTK